MKIKKIILFLALIITIVSIANFSFATEENIYEKVIKSDIVVNFENHFKLREELYKQNIYTPQNYYSNNANDLTLEEYIIQEVKNHNEAIDITKYQIPMEDMYSVIIPLFECDEILGVESVTWDGIYIDYDYETQTGTAIGRNVIYTYTMSKEEIDETWNTIDYEVKNYLKGIKAEWNNLEKIIYTNNYLCRNCEYATNIVDSSHTLKGALVDKLPVCDGYSKAFKYLLKQVGVEAELATSDSMVHAWNLVKIDNDYYHVDVTWNDTKEIGVGRTSYDYFLRSDKEFSKREHSDWVTNHKAVNTQYDTLPEWEYMNNYLIYKDNYWYGLSNSQYTYTVGLNKMDFRNGNQTEVKTIPTEYVYWSPGFTCDNENLYFSTKYAIWKMDFTGENIKEFLRLPDKTKAIYSIDFNNYKYYYDTTDIISNGYGSESSNSDTIKTNIYIPQTEKLKYTTLETESCDLKEIIRLKAKTNIDELLIPEYFPIIKNGYSVEVYSESGTLKEGYKNVGSKDIIKISNLDGTIEKEFVAIIPGDINGDGSVKIYDAFQILKGVLVSGNQLTEIDYIIRDFNQDGEIRIYDAFQYLKKAILE